MNPLHSLCLYFFLFLFKLKKLVPKFIKIWFIPAQIHQLIIVSGFISGKFVIKFIESIFVCFSIAATKWLKNVNVSLKAVQESAEFYSTCGQVSGINEVIWALKALQLTDLTTLAGDDTSSNVRRLCIRAAFPFTDHELRFLDEDVRRTIHTAAVCVYPSRVHDAYETLHAVKGGEKIEIAAGI